MRYNVPRWQHFPIIKQRNTSKTLTKVMQSRKPQRKAIQTTAKCSSWKSGLYSQNIMPTSFTFVRNTSLFTTFILFTNLFTQNGIQIEKSHDLFLSPPHKVWIVDNKTQSLIASSQHDKSKGKFSLGKASAPVGRESSVLPPTGPPTASFSISSTSHYT